MKLPRIVLVLAFASSNSIIFAAASSSTPTATSNTGTVMPRVVSTKPKVVVSTQESSEQRTTNLGVAASSPILSDTTRTRNYTTPKLSDNNPKPVLSEAKADAASQSHMGLHHPTHQKPLTDSNSPK